MRQLKILSCSIKPREIFFNTKSETDKLGKFIRREKFGQIIPLDLVFKVFLELPNVFKTLQNCYFSLTNQDNSVVSKNIQTEFWKSKVNSEKITFPLFLYEDGFETGNPLGSHAGVYNINKISITFPSMPVKFISKLNNIFLAQIYHADDA